MRVFIPATLLDLTEEVTPARAGIIPVVTEDGPDALELAEFEAMEDASVEALELIRESDTAPYLRVVIALEVKDAAETLQTRPWKHVKALFVDSAENAKLVAQVCQAQTQDAADEAVENLLEEDLEWYVPEELPLLRKLAVDAQR